MSFWRWGHQVPIFTTASPVDQLLSQASGAFYAKHWQEAERLYRRVLNECDVEARQVARNLLGQVYERQKRVDEAVTLYEANVVEQCPFGFYYRRLAIIYRRQGRTVDEKRILLTAAQALPNSPARQWFADRLTKMRDR